MLSDIRNDAFLEKLERAKQKTKSAIPKWPDRHLIGKDGTPVPFHRAQELLWDSNRRIIVFAAGSQVGKTALDPWWMNREIKLRGPGDYLAVTSSYDLFKLKLLPAFLQVFEHILQSGRFWAGDKIIELADPVNGKFWATKSTDTMWGRIILRSAQALGGLESSTAKGAVLDEAGQDEFTIDAYRAIRRRLTLNRGRLLLTTTLYSINWIVSEIITPAMKSGETKTLTLDNAAEIDYTDSEKADTTVIQADSTVNPEFPKEEYEEAKATLPSDVFAMFYRGRVTRPRHMIYDVFDEEKHLCPVFVIPSEWPRWIGLDFGGVNTHAVYVAQDPLNKRIYIYREYHSGKKSAAEHVTDMMFGEPGVPVCYGGAKAEGQWRQEFRTAGLPIREPKISDVWLGINRVYALLKEGLPEQARVQIFDNCGGLITELNSYHRKTDNQGNPIDDEIAQKSIYHGCFPAGTMIETDRGQVPIENIRIGMMAKTRNGFSRITDFAMTGKNKPLMKIKLSDGRELTGTPNHPIYVENKGFTPLSELAFYDIVNVSNPIKEKETWLKKFAEKILSSTDSLTRGIQTAIAKVAEDTSENVQLLRVIYTGIYGNTTTARFPMAWKSITLTGIRGITTYPILKPLQRRNTHERISSDTVVRQQWPRILQDYGPLPLSGMVQKRDISGIFNTALKDGMLLRKEISYANNVVNPLKRESRTIKQDSVVTIANRNGEGVWGLMTWIKNVLTVTQYSVLINMLGQNVAPPHVQHVLEAGHGDVYNLTVDQNHEYYANGILVSNCDSLRYIFSSLPQERKTLIATV